MAVILPPSVKRQTVERSNKGFPKEVILGLLFCFSVMHDVKAFNFLRHPLLPILPSCCRANIGSFAKNPFDSLIPKVKPSRFLSRFVHYVGTSFLSLHNISVVWHILHSSAPHRDITPKVANNDIPLSQNKIIIALCCPKTDVLHVHKDNSI